MSASIILLFISSVLCKRRTTDSTEFQVARLVLIPRVPLCFYSHRYHLPRLGFFLAIPRRVAAAGEGGGIVSGEATVELVFERRVGGLQRGRVDRAAIRPWRTTPFHLTRIHSEILG